MSEIVRHETSNIVRTKWHQDYVLTGRICIVARDSIFATVFITSVVNAVFFATKSTASPPLVERTTLVKALPMTASVKRNDQLADRFNRQTKTNTSSMALLPLSINAQPDSKFESSSISIRGNAGNGNVRPK